MAVEVRRVSHRHVTQRYRLAVREGSVLVCSVLVWTAAEWKVRAAKERRDMAVNGAARFGSLG